MTQLRVEPTAIDGLLFVHLPVLSDPRGWFKENWQRAKMIGAGLPDFVPVQNNVSFNAARGVTRGMHAEPWDKYISVATGEVFAAWVDLREGPGFGRVVTCRMGPGLAAFVPRGVANGYQTLEDASTYTYLVTAHWSADATYANVNPADPRLQIEWPIPLAECVLSTKDTAAPQLADVEPVLPPTVLVLGGGGQLASAVAARFEGAGRRVEVLGRDELDLTDPAALAAHDWTRHDVVVNAAAHTDVDGAETSVGRRVSWAVNADGVRNLATAMVSSGATLVHVSTDYVFDGSRALHLVDEPLSPLGVYGQSKAAGELAAALVPHHYVVRTSWLVGDGVNFAATMLRLARDGVDPSVVDDQVGRLSFTTEVARGIEHLMNARAPWGTYHLTCDGEPRSWYEHARAVFRLAGHDPARVTPVSTADYARSRPGMAPRPAHSTLDLSSVEAAGFEPRDQDDCLAEWLAITTAGERQ